MIRREPTYLSTDVWRALWLLSKSKTHREGGVPGQTPDEFADEILRESLKAKYPQLFEHQKEVAKMEEKLLKSLTT